MIDKYHIKLSFVNDLQGGIPILNENLDAERRAAKYVPWLSKQSDLAFDPDGGFDANETAVALAEDETMPLSDNDVPLNGFRRVLGRPVIETRQVKAMLKIAFSRTGMTKQFKLGQVLQHDLVVRALDNGDFLDLGVEDITGICERPIHVQTPQGPRASIAMNEYISGAEVEFVVKVFRGGLAGTNTITEERLQEALEYAQEFEALGANRAQGFGRFKVEEVRRG